MSEVLAPAAAAAAPRRSASPAIGDVDVDRFLLNFSAGLDVRAEDALLSARIVEDIGSPSQLAVRLLDPARDILKAPFTRYAVDVSVDEWIGRLARIAKTGEELDLTFEHRPVALLRRYDKPRKASRAKVTRAQFIRALVREERRYPLGFYAPELTKRQPVAAPDRDTRAERDEVTDPGLDSNATLYIKGEKATREQLRNIERVLTAAERYDPSRRPLLALIEAGIVESRFLNKQGDGDDAVSWGIFQAIPGTSRGIATREQALDIERCVRIFLVDKGFTSKGGAIELARENPGWKPGQIAAEVEGPLEKYRGRYEQYRDEADAILEAWGGPGRRGRVTSGYFEKYEFTRGDGDQREDSWTCIQRLANEVQWAAFFVGNTLWYVSQDDLFKAKPRLTLREGTPGVDWIDFEYDFGNTNELRRFAEVTVKAQADRWLAPLGTTIAVDGMGPIDGRWLVARLERDLMRTETTITLRKPVKEKPEPRSTFVTVTETTSSGGASRSSDSVARRVYDEAKRISEANPPYLYGGGHGPLLRTLRSSQGLDCSSSTSLALWRADAFDGDRAIVSGQFAASWGKPGKGKEMTVWANAEHVFIEFRFDQEENSDLPAYARFDTSPHGDGGSGARLRRGKRPTAGFTARHMGEARPRDTSREREAAERARRRRERLRQEVGNQRSPLGPDAPNLPTPPGNLPPLSPTPPD
jgi:hypothetical protein